MAVYGILQTFIPALKIHIQGSDAGEAYGGVMLPAHRPVLAAITPLPRFASCRAHRLLSLHLPPFRDWREGGACGAPPVVDADAVRRNFYKSKCMLEECS